MALTVKLRWAHGVRPYTSFRGTWNALVEDPRSSFSIETMSRFVDKDILDGRLTHPYGFDPI
jgi:hypothetical protein